MPDQIKFNSPWAVATMEALFNDVVSAKGSAASLTAAMAAKQDLLTVGTNMDASPTDGHTTVPVTSDGVYDAIEAAKTALLAAIYGGSEIQSNDDLNDAKYRVPGRYYSPRGAVTTSLNHTPSTIGNYGFSMEVFNIGGNIEQMIISGSSTVGKIYTRAIYVSGGTFSYKDWMELAGTVVTTTEKQAT